MTTGRVFLDVDSNAELSGSVIQKLRSIGSQHDLGKLMEVVSRALGFRYYALIHHADLREPAHGKVDIKDYPAAITERLIGRSLYRRDPAIRGCIFADSASLWSEIDAIIRLDRRDRDSFSNGPSEGRNDGITVPCDGEAADASFQTQSS